VLGEISCAKTAEPMEMPFAPFLRSDWCVLDGPRSPMGRDTFEREGGGHVPSVVMIARHRI